MRMLASAHTSGVSFSAGARSSDLMLTQFLCDYSDCYDASLAVCSPSLLHQSKEKGAFQIVVIQTFRLYETDKREKNSNTTNIQSLTGLGSYGAK